MATAVSFTPSTHERRCYWYRNTSTCYELPSGQDKPPVEYRPYSWWEGPWNCPSWKNNTGLTTFWIIIGVVAIFPAHCVLVVVLSCCGYLPSLCKPIKEMSDTERRRIYVACCPYFCILVTFLWPCIKCEDGSYEPRTDCGEYTGGSYPQTGAATEVTVEITAVRVEATRI
ncbi:uncharacterized protein LOC144859965 isoform X2 [Branchiostoma floridae x Branchiostoma japonicum]